MNAMNAMNAHRRTLTVVTVALLVAGAIGLTLWTTSTSAFADQGPTADGQHGRMMASDEDHPARMDRSGEQMAHRHARMHADGDRPHHTRQHTQMHDRRHDHAPEMQRHMDGSGPRGMGPGTGRGMGPSTDDPPCQRETDDLTAR